MGALDLLCSGGYGSTLGALLVHCNCGYISIYCVVDRPFDVPDLPDRPDSLLFCRLRSFEVAHCDSITAELRREKSAELRLDIQSDASPLVGLPRSWVTWNFPLISFAPLKRFPPFVLSPVVSVLLKKLCIFDLRRGLFFFTPRNTPFFEETAQEESWDYERIISYRFYANRYSDCLCIKSSFELNMSL